MGRGDGSASRSVRVVRVGDIALDLQGGEVGGGGEACRNGDAHDTILNRDACADQRAVEMNLSVGG